MSRLIFRKTTGFAKWVYLAGGLGVALLIPGFIGDEGFMVFFGCLGGMWIVVALVIAVAVAAAGKGQVTEMSLDDGNMLVRTVGLFGPGRSITVPVDQMWNWRWATQGAHPRLGNRLLMLLFDFNNKVYRIPISTAEVVDLEALRTVVPPAILDEMIANNPSRAVNRPAS